MHNLPRAEVRNLLNRIANRDDLASRRLYSVYQPQLFAYVRYRVWSDMSAEEITMDSLFIAFSKPAAYNGLSEFSTWLCGIANNRIRQWQRDMATELETEELTAAIADKHGNLDWNVLTGIEQDEATQAILVCIDKLPAGQREAIYRTAVEEEGLAEASRDMEVPEGTLKSRLFHARQRIRDCLARAFGPDYLGGNRG